MGEPGGPLRHSPFHLGFFGALGALVAFWLGQQVLALGGTIMLIVVAMFLAAGLNPVVEWFTRRGLSRTWSLVAVIGVVLGALTLFVAAIVPVITDQIAALTDNAPGWLDQLQGNERVQALDEQFQLIEKARDYVANGDFASAAFGGVVGVGLAVFSALVNTFIVVVLTLYFLASLDKTKDALYRLAPASRRDRVTRLGDRILANVGAYVSGAFVIAVFAGVTSLIFLFIVGLGQYAVALAFVVALLDVIPMIGATIGAVLVTAIGFATDPVIGLACLVFYVVYQQLENYVIYPKVMARSVDLPGAVIVIAALAGAGLLGVVGALLAIPTAAAILLLTREVFVRRQDAR
ncbi:AI-2E family transporter [Nocardioides sp. MJB4]|uniref:AI-2E family transporter n=2 Tax=Nocardioides donggukensis TaxID=2774019 RepID=A0A927Q021_9ACTN|nr:AI-2E family transporter [Nocardioides donggukensis]